MRKTQTSVNILLEGIECRIVTSISLSRTHFRVVNRFSALTNSKRQFHVTSSTSRHDISLRTRFRVVNKFSVFTNTQRHLHITNSTSRHDISLSLSISSREQILCSHKLKTSPSYHELNESLRYLSSNSISSRRQILESSTESLPSRTQKVTFIARTPRVVYLSLEIDFNVSLSLSLSFFLSFRLSLSLSL